MVDHIVTVYNVFVDKNTGEIFDANDVIIKGLNIKDCKLKEFR